MKFTEKVNHRLRFLFYGAMMVLVAACKDDDPTPGIATLEASSEQLTDGVYRGVVGVTDERGKLEITLSGSAPAGVKSLVVNRESTDKNGVKTTTVVVDLEEFVDEKEFEKDFTYTTQSADVGATTKLKAVVIDNRDREVVLELATIEAYWSLHSSEIVLETDTEDGTADFERYLDIGSAIGPLTNGPLINPHAVSNATLISTSAYNRVPLIFDYDPSLKGGEAVGYYLCSPNAAITANPDLVESFTVKNKTIVKIIAYSALTPEDQDLVVNVDTNDTRLLVNLFEKYQPTATAERLNIYGVEGDEAIILFKTNEGKIGLIFNHEILKELDSGGLRFDLLMMR